MALETDEGNMIHDVSSGILKYILLIRELLYSISCKVHSMPFPDFCFDCELWKSLILGDMLERAFSNIESQIFPEIT